MKYQYYKLIYARDEFPYYSSSKNIIWHCSKEFAEASCKFFTNWAEKTGYLNVVQLEKLTSTTSETTIWEPVDIYTEMKSHAYITFPVKELEKANGDKELTQKLILKAEQTVDKFLDKKLFFEIDDSREEKNSKIYKKED